MKGSCRAGTACGWWSTMRPAIRRCRRTRRLASADAWLFALHLQGAESERAMLANRGDPAAWLVHRLNARHRLHARHAARSHHHAEPAQAA